jgi:predicted kinase
MQKVYLLCGLPGAGKSTWARKKVAEEPLTVILSRDDFRTMIHGGVYVFDKIFEALIKDMEHKALSVCLEQGFNVILDETNIKAGRRKELLDIVAEKATTVCVIFKEQENNLRNRMKEPRGYTEKEWEDVIDRMKREWEDVTETFNEILYV